MEHPPPAVSSSLRSPHAQTSIPERMSSFVDSQHGGEHAGETAQRQPSSRKWGFKRARSKAGGDDPNHTMPGRRPSLSERREELTLEHVSHRNILQVIEHVRALQDDARLMLAVEFLKKAEAVIADPSHAHNHHVQQAAALVEGEMRPKLDELRERSEECASTLKEWEADDWIVSQTMMGVTTSYKKDPNGSLWVKLNGVMEDVPVFDQMATVREVDLFELWVPFCRQAYLLKRLGPVELLTYFNVSVPGLSRDAVMHAYACDCLLEDACILIEGKSVPDWPGVEIPAVKGWLSDRMIVHGFKARVELLSPTSASTSLQANVDPKAPLPQALIDFVMRRIAGMMLVFLVKASRRIGTQPGNPHRHRIQEDAEFYRDWMLPKFEQFYGSRGWPFTAPEYLVGPANGGSTANGAMVAARRGSDARANASAAFPPHPAVAASDTSSLTGSVATGRSKRSLGKRAKSLFKKSSRKGSFSSGGASSIEAAAVAEQDLDVDPRLLAKYQTWKERKRIENGDDTDAAGGVAAGFGSSTAGGFRASSGGFGPGPIPPPAAANGTLRGIPETDLAAPAPLLRRAQRLLAWGTSGALVPPPQALLPLYVAVSVWSGLWDGARDWVLGFAAEALLRGLLLQLLFVGLWHRAVTFGPPGGESYTHTKAFLAQYVRMAGAATSAVLTVWAGLSATWKIAVARLWHGIDHIGFQEWQAAASESMAASAVLMAVLATVLLIGMAVLRRQRQRQG